MVCNLSRSCRASILCLGRFRMRTLNAQGLAQQVYKVSLERPKGIEATSQIVVVFGHLGRHARILQDRQRLADGVVADEIVKADDPEALGLDIRLEDFI